MSNLTQITTSMAIVTEIIVNTKRLREIDIWCVLILYDNCKYEKNTRKIMVCTDWIQIINYKII